MRRFERSAAAFSAAALPVTISSMMPRCGSFGGRPRIYAGNQVAKSNGALAPEAPARTVAGTWRWSSPFGSDNLDSHSAARPCQPAIPRNEPRIQRLSKSQIRRVISCQIVPHFPDARKQDEMGIAREWKVNEIAKRFGAPFSGDDA